MFLNVVHNSLDKVSDAFERPPPNPFVGQVSQPSFHQVEPGTGCRGKVHVKARMSLEPAFDLWVLVGCIVVNYQIQVEIAWRFAINKFQKLDPLLVSVLLHARSDQSAFGQFNRSKQCGCSIAFVIVCQRAAAPRIDRQAGLGPVQSLNLAFLIGAKYQSMLRRIQIQSHNVRLFTRN